MRTFIVALLVLLLSAPAVQAHYYDGETGLDQNEQRDYNPGPGRYIESDPIGLRSDVNPYIYVLIIQSIEWTQRGLLGELIGIFLAFGKGKALTIDIMVPKTVRT